MTRLRWLCCQEGGEIEIHKRGRDNLTIQSIDNSTMTRNPVGKILFAMSSFDNTRQESSKGRNQGNVRGNCQCVHPCLFVGRSYNLLIKRIADANGCKGGSNKALPCFLGRNDGQESVPAKEHSKDICHGIIDNHQQGWIQDPH